MTCRAAIRASFDAVTRYRSITARGVFEKLRWWTPETVEEALDHLVFEEQKLVRVTLAGGIIAYRRPDAEPRPAAKEGDIE